MTKQKLVRTKGDITSAFPITIGLHQGSTLNLYLFVLAMDELIRSLQHEVPYLCFCK